MNELWTIYMGSLVYCDDERWWHIGHVPAGISHLYFPSKQKAQTKADTMFPGSMLRPTVQQVRPPRVITTPEGEY